MGGVGGRLSSVRVNHHHLIQQVAPEKLVLYSLGLWRVLDVARSKPYSVTQMLSPRIEVGRQMVFVPVRPTIRLIQPAITSRTVGASHTLATSLMTQRTGGTATSE